MEITCYNAVNNKQYKAIKEGDRMLYVAYGSNMNLEQMDWRCPNSELIGTGIIKDYRLVFNTHADIIPTQGAYVPVVVWDVPAQDWEYLDVYEGYPKYYVKENVTVNMDDGNVEECVVYVMSDENKGFEPPFDDYWDTIIDGYEDNGITDTSALYSALSESWEMYNKKEVNYAETEI